MDPLHVVYSMSSKTLSCFYGSGFCDKNYWIKEMSILVYLLLLFTILEIRWKSSKFKGYEWIASINKFSSKIALSFSCI